MDKLRDRQDEKPKEADRQAKDHKVKDRERGKVITNKRERQT